MIQLTQIGLSDGGIFIMADIAKNQEYTFENVWAALLKSEARNQEFAQEQKESWRKQDEMWQKQDEMWRKQEESHRKIDESLAKLEKTVANMSKNLGGLGNMQGRLTEAMFEPELCWKFYEIGFSFDSQIARKTFKENGQFIAEADFFLENGEYAMPVEVKTELSVGDIDGHIERLTKIREYMNGRKDNRKLVGAVAGEIVGENVLNYAHRKGLYVLTQTGDSVAVCVPNDFIRHEW